MLRLNRFARGCLAVLLLISWTGAVPALAQPARTGSPAVFPDDPTPEDLARLADHLERTMRAVESAHRAAPRDSFDPQAVLATVGRDPDALFAFVRDQTYYLPYRGALRGPAGVLMERGGNALDRALLLAVLLRGGGHEVRLARATLSELDAKALAARVKAPPAEGTLVYAPAPAPATTDAPAVDPASDGGLQSMLLESQRMAEEAAARVERDLELVSAALAKAGVRPGAKADDVVAVDADHWWVQRRTDDGWVSLDPLAADAKPGDAVVPPQDTVELDAKTGAPLGREALWHEVEIRVVVEQFKGGKLSEKSALKHVLRPADLGGQQVSLMHLPLGWSDEQISLGEPDSTKKLVAAVATHKQWRPILQIGGEHVSQLAFDTSGEVSAKADGNPMAKMGESLSGALGAFGGALGDPAADAADPGVLTSVWVEYEIRAVGRPPVTTRRPLFDLIGPAARVGSDLAPPAVDPAAAARRGLALLGEVEILVQGGQISAARIEDLLAASLAEARPHMLEMLRKSGTESRKDTAKRAAKIRSRVSALHGLAVARRLWNASGASVYIDRPNVLTRVRSLRLRLHGEVVVREGFDLVENGVRAVPGAPDPFAAVLRQGIADTAAEAVALRRAAPHNLSEMAGRAVAQGVTWNVAVRPADATLAQGGMSADARARAAAALASGAALVLPSRGIDVDGTPLVGWYRVDPSTGQTLGFLDTGEGAAMVEYAAIIVGVVTTVLTMFGCGGFAAGVSDGKFFACLTCGVLAGMLAAVVVMALWGGLVGGLAGAAAGKPGFVFGAGLGFICNAISGAAS